MDGLEREYGERVVFQRLRSGSREAAAVLRQHRLLGHGLVVTDAHGQAVWKSLGHNATRQQIEAAIRRALAAD